MVSVCASAVAANKPRAMTMCLVFMGCGVELGWGCEVRNLDLSLGLSVIEIERLG